MNLNSQVVIGADLRPDASQSRPSFHLLYKAAESVHLARSCISESLESCCTVRQAGSLPRESAPSWALRRHLGAQMLHLVHSMHSACRTLVIVWRIPGLFTDHSARIQAICLARSGAGRIRFLEYAFAYMPWYA